MTAPYVVPAMIPGVSELIPVLQIAIGPVILISGIGLLLLSMTNRLLTGGIFDALIVGMA